MNVRLNVCKYLDIETDHMNYKRIYDQLMNRARTRETLGERVERHHVHPSALGGSDEPENLVDLTLREHFIAHLLIVRFVRSKNEKIRMSQPLKLMGANLRDQYGAGSRRYRFLKRLYYEHHQMSLPEIRAKVSAAVNEHNRNRGCVDVVCACGCGTRVCSSVNPNLVRYIKGHFKPKNDVTPVKFTCGCGCGRDGETLKYKIREKNYIHGHNRPEPGKLSSALSKYIASLTDEERSARVKNSMGLANHEERVQAIKLGKSSVLRATFSDGTSIEFRSCEIPPRITEDYGRIKYVIKKHGGVHPSNPNVKYEYIQQYQAKSRWTKQS